MHECNMIAFFIMQIFCCLLAAFSNLKVLRFTQWCNTKETYSTEYQRHMSHPFFLLCTQNNRICASDYPAPERMKFICTVGTVKWVDTVWYTL